MKLDIDCMRDVLLTMENYSYGQTPSFTQVISDLPDYDKDTISYACDKLSEAGFINVVTKSYSRSQPSIVKIKDITFEGHQFLNDIREDSNWVKIKESAKNVGSFSISTISQIATSIITSAIHTKLGL